MLEIPSCELSGNNRNREGERDDEDSNNIGNTLETGKGKLR